MEEGSTGKTASTFLSGISIKTSPTCVLLKAPSARPGSDPVKDKFGWPVSRSGSRKRNTWRVLAAGEGADEDIGNRRRAAAVAQSTLQVGWKVKCASAPALLVGFLGRTFSRVPFAAPVFLISLFLFSVYLG
jgi:hypothetical protein